MNIKWINIAGFGPSAWHLDDKPLEIPSMMHHHKDVPILVLHHHMVKLHPEHTPHHATPKQTPLVLKKSHVFQHHEPGP